MKTQKQITIRLPKRDERIKQIVDAVNQGIDSHLEACFETTASDCGGVVEFTTNPDDILVIIRRMTEVNLPTEWLQRKLRPVDITEVTRHYLIAALWTDTDNSDDSGGNPLEDNYSIEDIDPDCVAAADDDCRRFVKENAALIAASGLSDEQVGHDLWLTRNRHGTGFWDRGIGEHGDKLTDAAHETGERYTCVSEGVVYIE